MQQAVAARFANLPEAYTIQGGKQQKKADRIMKMQGKGEPKAEFKERIERVQEGRKRLRQWQAQRPAEEAAEEEAKRADPLLTYTDLEGWPV